MEKVLYSFYMKETPVHRARFITKWFSKFGVGQLDSPAESPSLSSTRHLWNELERQL